MIPLNEQRKQCPLCDRPECRRREVWQEFDRRLKAGDDDLDDTAWLDYSTKALDECDRARVDWRERYFELRQDKAVDALFAATPEQLGETAVRAARPTDGLALMWGLSLALSDLVMEIVAKNRPVLPEDLGETWVDALRANEAFLTWIIENDKPEVSDEVIAEAVARWFSREPMSIEASEAIERLSKTPTT